MEAKPIVTSHGNQVLFSSLLKPLLEDLPKEPAEWRRSYGRPARNVHLEASFVPYDDDILPDDSVKTLVSRLYFHIYWTDCDLETYKQKIKEEIVDWTTALKAKNISDWMIVVVNSDENKNKSKLLPRSSVYDKIKSDFCGKYPERIVILEPLRGEREHKAVELWTVFLSRLRQLLLQAFTRHLQKYEDNMRALREKRNDVGWNFQNYFIVQEELAFMFEMLGLYDDAMIQYDELDALFTQFVVNHASGRLRLLVQEYVTNNFLPEDLHPILAKQVSTVKSINLESVPWLKSMVKPCKGWAGLSLQKQISWEKRNMIKDNEASLLEFRNYLFTRQCALLLLVKKPGEIIQRAIDYLHETVQEMKTLEIEICDGGLDCWVYLSGLEVLLKCENLTDSVNPRSQALNTAYLWDYVCRKLHKLGLLCGLMPGSAPTPSSEQLSRVIDLTSGMGLEAADDNDEEDEDSVVISPRDKLREALSSREAFQKIYLEQSELAMGTFKHIGRFRSARMIGKNLADFYMKLGEPQKAENFLLDAMTSYHQEGWKKLRDVARLELAQCQYQVANHHKYVKTGSQVASSSMLEEQQRLVHMKQVLDIAQNTTAGPIHLKASPLLKIDATEISATQIAVEESFQITVAIDNHAPCDISCDTIWLTLKDCTPDYNGSGDRIAKLKKPLARQTSTSSLDNRFVMNLPNVKKQAPSAINLRTHFEGSFNDPVSTGISCINSHELLKRNDSSGGMLKHVEEKVHKDIYSQRSAISDVILKPGENKITFLFEGVTAGHYQPGQAGVKVSHIEFLKDMTSNLSVAVLCDETYCEIIPDKLIAGTKQEVTVCLHSGNTAIEADSKMKVLPSADLSIATSCHDNMMILAEVARGGTCDWKMTLLQEPCVTGGETIDNKIAFDCSWLPRPLLTSVTFQNPFKVTHRLHTARDVKYIQVTVAGQCETEFMLTHWTLQANENKDVDLVCLNKPGQSLKVNMDQSSSFVWQVKCNISELPPLDLTFTFTYVCLTEGGAEPRELQYAFTLVDFQTMLTMKADISPNGENKICKTGCLSTLKLQVLQMPVSKPLVDQELMYEVDGQSNWNIHGKSIGVFTLTGGSFSTSLEVVPLIAGFLPLPKVKLYKYTRPQKSKNVWGEKAGFEEDECLDSTEDESSDSEEKSTPHSDFEQGQVYYSSMGKQVHVYPVEVDGEVEVTIV